MSIAHSGGPMSLRGPFLVAYGEVVAPGGVQLRALPLVLGGRGLRGGARGGVLRAVLRGVLGPHCGRCQHKILGVSDPFYLLFH